MSFYLAKGRRGSSGHVHLPEDEDAGVGSGVGGGGTCGLLNGRNYAVYKAQGPPSKSEDGPLSRWLMISGLHYIVWRLGLEKGQNMRTLQLPIQEQDGNFVFSQQIFHLDR